MGRTFKHDRDWGRPKTRYKKPKNKISSPKKDNKITTFEYEDVGENYEDFEKFKPKRR